MNFNTCLDVQTNIKSSDFLPDVVINGATCQLPEYFLVKFPINDPNAYLLGHITNCCQYIGENGEQCIIDGLTLKNNGFYVLLKKRKSSHQDPPIINGKIDYQHFSLLGQGYAWLSQFGNFTFDSWENLRPEAENPVIMSVLGEFANEIVKQNLHIVRVTIGTGGKTPEEYSPPIKTPEKMLEGAAYGDANIQVLIHIDKDKQEKIKLQISSFIEKLHLKGFFSDINEASFSKKFIELLLKEDLLISTYFPSWLERLFLTNDAQFSFWKNFFLENNQENLDKFTLAIANNGLYLWQIIFQLEQDNILSADNIKLLLTLDSIDPCQFTELSKAGILTNENLKLLVDNSKKIDANILNKLNQVKILFTDIFKLLANADYISSDMFTKINEVLLLLYKAKILSTENVKLLLANPTLLVNATKLESDDYDVFDVLNIAHMLKDDNFKLLANNPEKIDEDILYELYKANLLNDDNFKLLIMGSDKLDSTILSVLNDANILNEPNLKLLVKFAGGFKDYSHIFILLNDHKMLTNDNFQLIIDKDISTITQLLFKWNIPYFLDKNQQIVKANKEEATLQLYLLAKLAKAQINTDENRIFLQKFTLDDAILLSKALVQLSNEKILTDENRNLLKTVPAQDAHLIADTLVTLNKNQLTDENRTLALKATPALAHIIIDALIRLDHATILTETNRALIDPANPYDTLQMVDALVKLHKANLLTDENRKLLDPTKPWDANVIADALIQLNVATLLSDENRTFVTENVESAKFIVTALINLTNANLLTKENRQLISSNPQYVQCLECALINLQKSNLLTDKNRQFIVDNFKNIDNIADLILHLNKNQLMSDENIKLINENPQHAWRIVNALIKFKNHNFLNNKTRQIIIEKPNHAEDLMQIMLILQSEQLLSNEIMRLIITNSEKLALSDALRLLLELDMENKMSDENVKLLLNNISLFANCNTFKQMNPIFSFLKIEATFAKRIQTACNQSQSQSDVFKIFSSFMQYWQSNHQYGCQRSQTVENWANNYMNTNNENPFKILRNFGQPHDQHLFNSTSSQHIDLFYDYLQNETIPTSLKDLMKEPSPAETEQITVKKLS